MNIQYTAIKTVSDEMLNRGNPIGSAAALQQINKVIALTDGIAKEKQEYLSSRPRLSSDRSRIVTNSWKETEGQPMVIRRAKLFQKVMEEISISIREDELIIGAYTPYIRGIHPSIDFNADMVLLDLSNQNATSAKKSEEREISNEDRRILLEDAKYWKDKTPSHAMAQAKRAVLGTYWDDALEAHLYADLASLQGINRTADYEKVLNKGLESILDEIDEACGKLTLFNSGPDASISDPHRELHRLHVLEAMKIGVEAAIKFAARYAKLARDMAAKETKPERKEELERIAEICERVPAKPARTFYEAVQSCWFIFLSEYLEVACLGQVTGRLDQYLYPFYEKDISEGRITRQQAGEILAWLYWKIAKMESFKEQSVASSELEGSEFLNVTIGGVKEDGSDATNELSFLILEIVRQLKTHNPHVTLRYHDGLSEEFLIKAAEVNRDVGAGIPQWMNDKTIIPYLESIGTPPKDARGWFALGCVDLCVPGHFYEGKHMINATKVLDLALHDGKDIKTGKQLGPKTGNPSDFASFEQVYDAFKKQFEYMIGQSAKQCRVEVAARAQTYATPFSSAMVDGCIKNGLDGYEGGQRNTMVSPGVMDKGQADIADSLTAIKKLVFDEKRISMDQLMQAINDDFEGHEEIHKMCMEAPKWGNDDDYADSIMKDVWESTLKTIKQEKDHNGKPMNTGRNGTSFHVWAGHGIGALPNGRKAWKPVAPAGLDMMGGIDTEGPTALLNSCMKLDNSLSEAAVLNMKFSPSLLKTREGIKKYLNLIKVYFDYDAPHIQFNLVDKEVLLNAKAHPEQYRDLIIRVSGYSAIFVELDPELQDEIIGRAEYTF